MNVPIAITSTVYTIWLIIPFRQLKTKYFFYFLIYAVSSVFMLLDYTLLIHPAYFYLGTGFFLIISLYNFKNIPHYILFLTGVFVISIALPFLLSIDIITFCLIVEHISIFVILLKRTVLYSVQQERLNIFHFILLLYEITLITRFIVVMGNIKTGIIFFYLTAAFGILIGIFFLFYNEKNSPKLSLGKGDIFNTD
jgi:hypothetical protein